MNFCTNIQHCCCWEQRMLVNCWHRCKASPLLADLIHLLFYLIYCYFERLSAQALEQEAVFQSSGSFSLCVASLVNSPGVITAKIRLSIRRYYHQACGLHSGFTPSLTPAPCHHVPRVVGQVPGVK